MMANKMRQLLSSLPLLLLLITATTTTYPPTTTCTPNHDIHKTTDVASTGINDLGFDLLRKLDTFKNYMISPYSLWSVLAMVLVGAEGKTKTELIDVLGLKDKTGSLAVLRNLGNELLNAIANDSKVSLDIANRIYTNDGFTLRQCQEELSDLLVQIPFTPSEPASDMINKFVNTTTRGLISNIIQPSQLTPNTRMVLINALYFKGIWQNPFHKRLTRKEPFYSSPNATPEMVDMMNHNAIPVFIGESRDLKAEVMRMPYSTGLLSMTILLPNEAGEGGFNTTLNSLNSTSMRNTLESLKKFDIILRMPKFEIKSDFANDLKLAMNELGMRDAFKTTANLTSFGDNLYVSHLMQTTVVKVNEEGSEAAAVTAGSIGIRSTPIITLNRPFLFLIHSKDTILFIGAYKKP